MISSTDNSIIYDCDGSQTLFPFNFPLLEKEDLIVTLIDSEGSETELNLGVHYTMSAASNDYMNGGNVTTISTYAAGNQLALVREVSLTQETDYEEGDSFPAEVHEAALDRLTLIVQQLDAKINRQMIAPLSDGKVTLTLPKKSERANKLLGFDADGNPVAVSP